MKVKTAWTIQSLITCFFLNAILVAALLYLAQQVLTGIHQWIDPFAQQGGAVLPEDAQSAFSAVARMLQDCGRYLIPVGAGLGGGMTLLLWIVVMAQGRSAVGRAAREGTVTPSARPEEAARPTVVGEPAMTRPAEAIPGPSPEAAVQILSVLQREGRFVDFLQEDLSGYDDAQIGAAVRGIHEGCRQALGSYVQLKAVLDETEGDMVTVSKGFDARAIRLTGNVMGDPPFKGTLRHRGWKVVRMDLPGLTADAGGGWILAPAEVEIEG